MHRRVKSCIRGPCGLHLHQRLAAHFPCNSTQSLNPWKESPLFLSSLGQISVSWDPKGLNQDNLLVLYQGFFSYA